MNEAAAQKIVSLQRCAVRARRALEAAGATFDSNPDAQDVAVLNVLRACETAIDLAHMLIPVRKIGLPTDSRDSFAILVRERLLPPELGTQLQKMVGFRNLAVHRYRELDLAIVRSVVERGLDDVLAFAEVVRAPLGA